MSDQAVNEQSPEGQAVSPESAPRVRSLKELIDLVSGRSLADTQIQEEAGFAEKLPFPFLALVGQMEMKLALLLAVINPNIGGVLLVGPRGTGKTTAVRGLVDLLPPIQRSTCFYGCTAEDIEAGGMDAVCPDCAKKYLEGTPLTRLEPAVLVELPLNARLEDVIGGVDERAVIHERYRLKRGILSRADQNILYIDEVNLLPDEIVDAILDASAQQQYTVRRGGVSATYRSRFTLIGSMNPEEGNLRPQIMDRFGLRVIVHGLTDPMQRYQAYQWVRAYRRNPRQFINQFADETLIARQEICAARDLLAKVTLPNEVAHTGIDLIQRFKVDSLRAEITLFEACRAYAAADGRTEATVQDLLTVAPMALRLRRSMFMVQYFNQQAEEEQELNQLIQSAEKKLSAPS